MIVLFYVHLYFKAIYELFNHLNTADEIVQYASFLLISFLTEK